MYIAFENDPRKNDKTKKIVFIICMVILFLMWAIAGQSQTCIKHKQNSTYYAPCQPELLKFIDDTTKKLAVGIYVDGGETVVYINYYNKDNVSADNSLLIGLVGEKVVSFKKRDIGNDVNYSEFVIPKEYVEKMKASRFDFFATTSEKYFKNWVTASYSSSEYFRNFLNNYNKRVDVEILGESYSKY